MKFLRQARIKPRELGLLAGGPPCQPFSKSVYWSNGNGRRLHDPRAYTLGAYVRVIEAALPEVLLLEPAGKKKTPATPAGSVRQGQQTVMQVHWLSWLTF